MAVFNNGYFLKPPKSNFLTTFLHIKYIVDDSNYIRHQVEGCNCVRRIYEEKLKFKEADILEEKPEGKEMVFIFVAKRPN